LIRNDNLTVAGGRTPLEQLGLYLWGIPRSLGLAVWLFFVVGLALAALRGWRHRLPLTRLGPAAAYRLTRSPYIVPLSALALHFASLLAAGYHGKRHLLPFVPVMCFLAAIGFSRTSAKLGSHRVMAGAMLLTLVAYQMYNAVGVEAGYAYDIRNALAAKVSEVASPSDDVVTFTGYSLVRGSRLAEGSEATDSRISSEFFVSCDIE